MNRLSTAVACLGPAILITGCQPQNAGDDSGPRVIAATDIEAGRYMVLVSGCNDCHTPRYAMTEGAEPLEAEWLKGSSEGIPGPWGVSYGKNLRLTVASMTEDEWVQLLNTGTSLPPMPWLSTRAMAEADKRAVYRYIRSLPGETGRQTPAPLPPG